jgi:hypothetical protein
MDIEKWLRSLGLQHYVAAFRDNAIDVEILPELTEADLERSSGSCSDIARDC